MATASTSGYGTLLQRATKVASTGASGVVGNNNAITWTAVTEGVAGDLVNFTLTDPGGTNPLLVSVAGVAITVQLQTVGAAIVSTAAEVIAAIRASAAAFALAVTTNTSTSTGAGVMVAQGQTFLAGGSDTETYTTIAEVRSITGPNITLGTVEATHHTSASSFKEYIPTLLDLGEVTFELNFLPVNVTQDQIVGLMKDKLHKILRAFQIVFTDATTTTASFSAFVTGFGNAAPLDGKLTANLSLKPSGSISFA